jgi:hypothetical protein
MTTHRPAAHVLIWRNPKDSAHGGASLLLGWHQYRRQDAAKYFKKHGDFGTLGNLAVGALTSDFGAILRNANVTIAWQPEPPESTPAAELEPIFRRLRPMTLVCPERPTGDRWAVSNFGAPEVFPASAIQGVIDNLVATMFPNWAPGVQFSPRGLMLRRDISAEELGLIAPVARSPDEICASVSEDPAVVQAVLVGPRDAVDMA